MNGGPLKRSAVHHVQVHEAATFTVQHGWEIAASFGDVAEERRAAARGVALADVSWLGKFECKGLWAESLAREPLAGATPCPVTPTRLLWIVDPPLIDPCRKTLEQLRAGQPRCYLIDVSSVYASFDLMGPHGDDVLCKISSARPEAGEPIFAPVSGIRTLLVRHERGLQLHFQREFGEYVWHSVLDAGREFGIRPAGVDAISTASVEVASVGVARAVP
jgi:glycine cleavage system aminomethyltransferase T